MAIQRSIPITLGSDSHVPGQVGFLFPEMVETLLPASSKLKLARYSQRRRQVLDLDHWLKWNPGESTSKSGNPLRIST